MYVVPSDEDTDDISTDEEEKSLREQFNTWEDEHGDFLWEGWFRLKQYLHPYYLDTIGFVEFMEFVKRNSSVK